MIWKREKPDFWTRWSRLVEQKSDRYITPTNSNVRSFSDSIEISESDTDIDRAYKVWQEVRNSVEYEMSTAWKTPEETLTLGKGDCQDVTFLIASILPNVGVDNSQVVIGSLQFPDERIEEHTWNRVDNQVIDGTGDMNDIQKLDYDAMKAVDIISKKEVEVEQ